MKKSLKSATNKKIIIGKIGAAHGVRGDMKVYPLTDFPDRFNTIGRSCLSLSALHCAGAVPARYRAG